MSRNDRYKSERQTRLLISCSQHLPYPFTFGIEKMHLRAASIMEPQLAEFHRGLLRNIDFGTISPLLPRSLHDILPPFQPIQTRIPSTWRHPLRDAWRQNLRTEYWIIEPCKISPESLSFLSSPTTFLTSNWSHNLPCFVYTFRSA